MEAGDNKPPPYSAVCNDPSSYSVRYETQNNCVTITAPQENMTIQRTEHSSVVVPNQIVQGTLPRIDDITFRAILICFCCCCYTGIPAIVYASEAQREYGAGNILKAEKYQKLAGNWIVASLVGCVVVVICIGLGVFLFFVILIKNIHYEN